MCMYKNDVCQYIVDNPDSSIENRQHTLKCANARKYVSAVVFTTYVACKGFNLMTWHSGLRQQASVYTAVTELTCI